MEDAEIDFYSWREPDDMREILGRLAAAPFFPVPLESTPAKKNFFRLPENALSLEGVTVTQCPLHHPQGCVAYRLEERGRSIVFATDTEHPASGIDDRLAAFAREADVLVYDAMYLPGEYAAERRGWGHSTWIEGTRLARAAGIHRLLLSHFNPDHLDRDIRAMQRAARREFRGTEAAAQGMIIKL